MIEPKNPILTKMLDRLFAAMLNGPSMNCRPHASRQRLDLTHIARLNDLAPGDVLMTLLSKEPTARLAARVPVAARKPTSDEPLTPEQHAAIDAYTDQQFVRTKLRMIAEEARTYEQDTGVCALNLGFPLLSLPPGTFGGRFGVAPSRRVLAPLAFIPLTVIVKTSSQLAVEMSRREGADAIIPNQALLAWLEKETGKPLGEILTNGDNPQEARGARSSSSSTKSPTSSNSPSPMNWPKSARRQRSHLRPSRKATTKTARRFSRPPSSAFIPRPTRVSCATCAR